MSRQPRQNVESYIRIIEEVEAPHIGITLPLLSLFVKHHRSNLSSKAYLLNQFILGYNCVHIYRIGIRVTRKCILVCIHSKLICNYICVLKRSFMIYSSESGPTSSKQNYHAQNRLTYPNLNHSCVNCSCVKPNNYGFVWPV